MVSRPVYLGVMTLKKSIPVTGRGGLQVCETLRIPHYLDIRLIDGGKVVSPTHRPRSTPRNIIFLLLVLIALPGTHTFFLNVNSLDSRQDFGFLSDNYGVVDVGRPF
jgi:hypothetical protein